MKAAWIAGSLCFFFYGAAHAQLTTNNKKPSTTCCATAPSYTPPPVHMNTPPTETHNTYAPPARTYNSGGTSSGGYTAPARNYTANASGSAPARTYTPGSSNNSASVHTYTPGSSNNSSSVHTYRPGGSSGSSNSNGVHTYTPNSYRSNSVHTYTPGSSNSGGAHAYTPSVSSSNGVTTYTPHAPSASGSSRPNATFVASPAHGATASSGYPPPRSLAELNTARSSMHGLNAHPLPAGTVTPHGSGYALKTASGHVLNLRPNGTVGSYKSTTASASMRSNGQIASLRTSTLSMARRPNGSRTVVMHKPGQTMVVSQGKHVGYVQRPGLLHGKPILERTLVPAHGAPYTQVFHAYSYHGQSLAAYEPDAVFSPAFYGWAYYPWVAPARIGWADVAMSGVAGYFGWSPEYGSPSDYLTDYIMGQTMADDAQDQQDGDMEAPAGEDASQYSQDDQQQDGSAQDAAPVDGETLAASADTPVTQDMKAEVSKEVTDQVGYENVASTNDDPQPKITDLPQVMAPNHLFVVNQAIGVPTSSGAACNLGAGDVIEVITAPADGDTSATLKVNASRKGECPADTQVMVSLDALQEMQNNFREKLNSGLVTLHDKQGQNGIPAAPPSAMAEPVKRKPRRTPTATETAATKQSIQDAQKEAGVTEASVEKSVGAVGPHKQCAGQCDQEN